MIPEGKAGLDAWHREIQQVLVETILTIPFKKENEVFWDFDPCPSFPFKTCAMLEHWYI